MLKKTLALLLATMRLLPVIYNSFRKAAGSSLMLIITCSVCSAQDPIKTATNIKHAAERIVLLNNEAKMIPFQQLSEMNIASVHFHSGYSHAFDSIANKYWKVTGFPADNLLTDSIRYALHDKLKLFDHVIVTMSSTTVIDEKLLDFIKSLRDGRQLSIVLFGDKNNPETIESMASPLIWSPDETAESASVAAQLLFGGIASNNELSRSYGKKYKKGKGFSVSKTRLGYGIPESVALNSDFLKSIDSVVNAGIGTHATPGAVVLLIKDGQVIFDKAYGKHTYDGKELTKVDDIFDMASVTKVTATTPVIMQLYERHLINLDSPISKYVNVLKGIPDKKEIAVKEALLHEGGFTPYIKFYEKLTPLDLSFKGSALFPTAIAENFFLKKDYFENVMWPVTLQSPVLTRGKFVYSDVSMYMMKEVAENVMHKKLDDYILKEIYLPLGMQSSGFTPLKRFEKSRIVTTTENDNWVRNMTVTGFVNDPGAAMAGGVEGHAGLFSTTNDLGIFYQMMLNKGTYGGRKYFERSTVELFTSRQSKVTTRGYGFAKPAENAAGQSGFPSDLAYGHSGYTGTYVWVDPKYNMVYVCLTNRVYPDDGKTYGPPKINIRAQVLDLFYHAVITRK